MSLSNTKKKKDKKKTHWEIYGPVYFTALSVPLVMADLTRHILQDASIWPSPGSDEYRPDCTPDGIRCLSLIGWLFTIVFTWSGFLFLLLGVLWSADIHNKLRKAWKQGR